MNKKNRIILGILLVVVTSIAFFSYIIAAEDKDGLNKADGADAYSCSQELIALVGEENIDKVLVKAIVEEGFVYTKYVCTDCQAEYAEKINLCPVCDYEVIASEDSKAFINNDKVLTLQEIESIKNLEISEYKGIKNLKLLQCAKNLEKLSIQYCDIDNAILATLFDENNNCILNNCVNLLNVDFKYNKINNIDNDTNASLTDLIKTSLSASVDLSSQYIVEDSSPEVVFEDNVLKEKIISHPIMGGYDPTFEQMIYSGDEIVDQNGDGKVSLLELNQLDELYLPECGISSLKCYVDGKEYGLLELVPVLYRVDLRYNNIAETGNMTGLMVIDYINFSNNKLTSVENFEEIEYVDSIDLSYNKIESIISKREVEGEIAGFTTFETVEITDWNCYNSLKELDITENYVDIYSIETDETGNLVKTITLQRIEEAIVNHGDLELTINYKPQKVLASNDFKVENLDPNLEKLLKKVLKGDENSEAFVGKKEMLRLTSLDVTKVEGLQIDKISSIAGLEYAANLQSLNLSNQSIEDLSPIANLINLQEVNLENNSIDDLSKLLVNNEMKLRPIKVNLSKNYLNRANGIDNSVNDNVISLLRNNGAQVLDKIKYVGPTIDLNNSVNFVDVNLKNALAIELGKDANAQITREDLLKITTLNLSNKNIANLSGIEYLGNVTKINLSNNNISDVTALKYCTALEDVILSNCSLGTNNVDVNSLWSLPNLQKLNLSNNDISVDNIKWEEESNLNKASISTWNGEEETINYLNLSSNKLNSTWEEFITNLFGYNEKNGSGLTVNLYNVKDINGKVLTECMTTSKMKTFVNSFNGTISCDDVMYSIVTRNDADGLINLDKVNYKVELYGTQAGTVKQLKYARILNSKDLVGTNNERIEYFENLNKNMWDISFDTATFEVRDNGLYLIYAVIEENGVEHKITKYINVKCIKEIEPLAQNTKVGIYEREYIVGFELNTNKNDALNEFNQEKYLVEISDEVLKTGTSVIVKDKETSEELKEYIVIIYGDVNSDGAINSQDVSSIKKYLNNSENNGLNEFSKMAADINRDGEVTKEDMNAVINHCLEKENEIIIQKDYVG